MRVAAAVLCLAVAVVAPAAGSVRAAANGDIAFTQTFSDVWSILAMRADGTGARRLSLEPTHAAWPAPSPDGSLVAFASDRDGQWEIYVARADGTGVTRLTHSAADDYAPDWSADGTRLVFARGTASRSSLFVISARGGRARRVTRGARGDNDPSWSPNGKSIAFSRPRARDRYDLWVVEVATGRERRLTRGPRDDWGPRWSPNGREIAFTSGIMVRDDGYRSDIAVIRPDGSGRRRFTRLPAIRNSYPTWSPDGNSIAFWSTRGNAGVWVMSRNGRNRRLLRPTQCCEGWDYYDLRWSRNGTMTFSHEHTVADDALLAIDADGRRRVLTSGEGDYEGDVSWAKDGRSFVFTRFLGECCGDEIFVRSADGNERNVSNSAAPDRQPSLAPAGDVVAFATARDPEQRSADIWLIGIDGTNARPLVTHPDHDAQPDWSPAGREIVFTRFPATDDEAPPGDVFVTDLAGASRQLTTHPANDEEPRWSPDGTRIVFASTRDGGRFQLYTMAPDGSDQRRLLASDADDREPAWSPDGKQIVFDRFTRDRIEIWIVNADGTGARRFTMICRSSDCRENASAPSPAWQPRPPG